MIRLITMYELALMPDLMGDHLHIFITTALMKLYSSPNNILYLHLQIKYFKFRAHLESKERIPLKEAESESRQIHNAFPFVVVRSWQKTKQTQRRKTVHKHK